MADDTSEFADVPTGLAGRMEVVDEFAVAGGLTHDECVRAVVAAAVVVAEQLQDWQCRRVASPMSLANL